ncbi:DegT/DnrJ/EryC1/StrS family aminotransferase, partial [Acidovorax sp.]|uniref:DegT/DnrJ/EryC1/StrS family aminotransferase n=1 Tax=Acidovorax sp. TaxID=1872122 RepID=UPI0025C01AFC
RIDELQAERVKLAARYDTMLAALPLCLPPRLKDRESAWHLYAVELDPARTPASRAKVFALMREAGIGVNVHYIPVHRQPYYERLGFRRDDFPAAEAYYARAITLPLFPGLTSEQQEFVVNTLASALNSPSS